VKRPVGGLGRERLLEAIRDQEVELGVRRLDPGDRLLGELAGRNLAGADLRCEA
jgi:hypothetical protein